MSRTFIQFCFYLITHLLYSQCPVGDVYLNTQKDVEDYIANFGTCEVINGTLQITDATNISGITAIKRIEGSLIINYSKIKSVSNFGNLEFVGEDFKINHSSFIETIEGINKLHTVMGNFYITENSNIMLKEIKGFNSLKNISGNFQIADNQYLKTIPLFNNLLSIEGWLNIARNNSLGRIDGFNNLTKMGIYSVSTIAGNINIENNFALTEINGFNSLVEVSRGINIGQNANLVNLIAFSSLKKILRLYLNSCPLLVNIPNFDNLVTVGNSLEIWDTGLTQINGFNNIQIIGDLDPSFGNLYINENRNLIEIKGFTKLKKLEGELGIISNNKLTNLIGFSSLTETKVLNITSNEIIPNLNGLENLLTVLNIGGDAILIRKNNSLFDCSAICDLLTIGTISGRIIISENPSKCSSQPEIKQDCIQDFDNDGILNDDDLDDDNDGILDTVEQNGNPDRDSDGDYYPDHQDLDSDNDSCFDVIEAGFTDNDKNGILGNSPDTVDSNGLINSELNGYTQPIDSDNDGIFDFQQANILNAGENGTLELCINSNAVDLFYSLKGTPDTGGVWTPSLSSGTGIFNPSVDKAGIYTYTVTNGNCGFDTSEVNVTIDKLPNAGENGTLELCINSNAVDLFYSLKGTPDRGGVWTPILSSGTGIFNPSIDKAGIYTYTVTNGICGFDTSEVNVTIDKLPNAGENGTLELCINSNTVDLFYSLKGSPETGGVWMPILSSGTGIFNPSIDKAGIYTYTVTNGFCGIDFSEVNVTVINVLPILNYEIKITEFSDNNMIEIIINTNSNYEFSLDGINFQNNNLFDHLNGGEYTVYAQEINGCGFLQEVVYILDYPKFFTPNNDGFNDTWELKGETDKKYTIYIYDRFGKLLKKLINSEISWDGIYNGKQMPSDDYWFKIVFNDGLIKNGHFTLKR
jgi:gliding motility-associated-like protein